MSDGSHHRTVNLRLQIIDLVFNNISEVASLLFAVTTSPHVGLLQFYVYLHLNLKIDLIAQSFINPHGAISSDNSFAR